MKKVFVIIVTYKGKQWYDKCFLSLRESTVPVETIVIDNSSTNEDAEYIKTHYPEIHVIKTNENLGFGKANNFGLRYALDHGCDYALLLNQDTWLIQKDAIDKLIKLSVSHPEYGILSPMHLTADEKELSIQYENISRDCGFHLLSDIYCGQMKDIYATDYVNAAAWLLPRKTLETIGGFDPVFFLYGEDDNYLNRVIYHRLKIGVCPSIKIIHDHPNSTEKRHTSVNYRQKALLVQWTNINQPFSFRKCVRYYLRKWLVSLSSGDVRKAREIYAQYTYCKQMKKRVLQSRMENVQQKPSWL